MSLSDSFLYPVNCPTCKRQIGVSPTAKWGIYCDEFCAQDVPAAEQEGRDAIIEGLARDTDIPVARVATLFGVTRQRAYQLLAARDLRKAV